jgi:hypothetical protein
LLVSFTLVLFAGGAISAQGEPTTDEQLNLNGVWLLIDLYETISRKHTNYDQIAAELQNLDALSQREKIDEFAQANRQDPEITQKIEAVVSSAAYKLYYEQFKNVNAAVHREIFYYLPYWAKPSPGGIETYLYEMYHNLDSLKGWADEVISQLDRDKAREAAEQWLPDDDYTPPTTYFILDGNGDAFARDGKVCVDLYGTVLLHRSAEARYANLSEVNLDKLHGILAHEYHHIFAHSTIYPFSSKLILGWKSKWEDRLIRRMVSEGAAMHCNPPEGIKAEIMEDSMVVEYWMYHLNERLAMLDTGEVDESEYNDWLDQTYYQQAKSVLHDYLLRQYEGPELEEQVKTHMVYRPTMVYTLGWWMVSTISNGGQDRESLMKLLDDPKSLFTMYNDAAGASPRQFKVYAGDVD